MMRAKPWRLGWDLERLLFGLCLVLLSPIVGDWKDYLQQLVWSGLSPVSGHKFGSSAGLDRFPGWLVLLAGWYYIAHGLGGEREPPSDRTAGFARMRFRVRWLPVPILATLGTYGALAYHGTPPLVVTIDVVNAPPGVTIHGGPIVGRSAWYWSRYYATFDYLFGVPLPPRKVSPVFYNQPHSEFRFPAGRLSLQNWQPNLRSVVLGIEGEGKAALLMLHVKPGVQRAETITVTRQSLEQSDYGDTKGGAWLLQVASQSMDQREFHVAFDLAGIELKPYEGQPYYKMNLLWDP